MSVTSLFMENVYITFLSVREKQAKLMIFMGNTNLNLMTSEVNE